MFFKGYYLVKICCNCVLRNLLVSDLIFCYYRYVISNRLYIITSPSPCLIDAFKEAADRDGFNHVTEVWIGYISINFGPNSETTDLQNEVAP